MLRYGVGRVTCPGNTTYKINLTIVVGYKRNMINIVDAKKPNTILCYINGSRASRSREAIILFETGLCRLHLKYCIQF